MRSDLAGRFFAMAGLLVAGALTCASAVQGQVLEEGFFPEKAAGISVKPFSLSCPPRLYVATGESVLLSCMATGVSEEGVRYEWEAVSGGGLDFLSDAQSLSPLFTASLPGGAAEYAYRLTATGAGAYATATVTVAVQGASGQRAGAPVLQEECDPLSIPDEPGEGCAEDSGPFAFGFGLEPEGGFLFPAAPGAPDGGGLVSRTPPRLECSAAVFLEELETGAIECHAWDAAGEEHLDYFWEPVGSTTRDYLDNPRLIPEDSPTPSVIAPSFPPYETLESFLSGETTLRYRYRLTAVSRLTGLSSHEEVEVFVSGSRPVLYCPLEVVVEEGETVSLDCEGVDPLFRRMDYDEEAAAVAWEWEGLWGSDTALLDATHLSSPLFTAPWNSAGEEYHYVASMTSSASGASRTARRRVTVRVEGAEGGGRNATRAGASGILDNLLCYVFFPVYEGDPDKQFRCQLNPPDGDQILSETWTWEHSYDPEILSAANVPDPFFRVPDSVSETTRYHFRVRVDYRLSIGGNRNESQDAYATVSNLEVFVECEDPGSVQAGAADIPFSCSARYRGGSGGITWSWSPITGLTGRDTGTPRFAVPSEVDRDTTLTYTVTASARNHDPDEETIKVKVRNPDASAPSVRCENASIYEGAGGITLDCTVANEPSGAKYVWSGTDVASRLSGTDGYAPVFSAPGDIDEPGDADKNYEYTVTMSADGIADIVEEVRVTVIEKPDITWCIKNTFSDYATVWEGSGDRIESSACTTGPGGAVVSPEGAPGGEYSYWWSVRGDTPETAIDLLHSRTGMVASFSIPPYGTVDEDRTYEYQLAISAPNADAANWNWTVIVKNSEFAITCDDPDPVYEGSPSFDLSCFVTAPPGLTYVWSWSPADRLTDRDTGTPTFAVPAEVDRDTAWTYTARVTAPNAGPDPDEETVTVTVLNRGALAVSCADPGSVYEGADDVAFDCTASGAPAGSAYLYAWEARGDTRDTALLSAADIASPTFYVPDEVDETTTYEYLLTVSAANAENGSAEVMVTVLDRVALPDPDPASPDSDPASPLVASSSVRAPSDASALGITASASPLRFGMQSADTKVSLDPTTDGISTYIAGPYHAGRMTLSPGGDEPLEDGQEMNLSIEIVTPVLLKRKDEVESSSLVLLPSWSYAESCDRLSSQAIGGLYTETTLSESDCRLLLFGGELDLKDAPSGQYAGSLDLVLRSGEREGTFSVEVTVTVVPAQRVITIGPGGVRFSMSRELPVALTEEQNLSIYPDIAFLTQEEPHGVFELSNSSLIPLEVSVSARFGYREVTEDGREEVVEDVEDSPLGDLSQVMDIYPSVLMLMPGEKGLVRYGVEEGALASMSEQGYAAFFDVASEPRQYVRSDRMPEEASGERTARVTMSVPGVYVSGEAATQLRAALLSLSYGVSMSATFLVETGGRPFAGEVVAFDGDGRELGRRETLVYTRSRVRVPLDRMPEEAAVFLRFVPRGSGRAPEPAPVRWNAPERDIGAAEKKENPPATAVAGRP